MLPRKIFKIKGPRLAKNAFAEISARKNQIKISQHVALLFNLGVLKKLFAGFGVLSLQRATEYILENLLKVSSVRWLPSFYRPFC